MTTPNFQSDTYVDDEITRLKALIATGIASASDVFGYTAPTTDSAKALEDAHERVLILERVKVLTERRDKIRTSMEYMEEDNALGASFDGREINHLPLPELRDRESQLTIQINELLMNQVGESFIFGQSVRTEQTVIQRTF